MNRPFKRALAFLAAALLLAGCASADKNQTTPAKSAATKPAADTSTSTNMAGMNMGGSTVATQVSSVNGVRAPVASQVLATADWEGMKIQARTMTPATFIIFNGTREQLVKPTKHTSFHLMVMLDDIHTGVPIPYASVWATITNSAGKVVYDDVQWPMLSAYMGPHYGNNVSLPGPGHYKLKLQITPPRVARHLEYQHVWLKTHDLTESFNWNPPK